jgi:ribosomal protein L37AE/L43A
MLRRRTSAALAETSPFADVRLAAEADYRRSRLDCRLRPEADTHLRVPFAVKSTMSDPASCPACSSPRVERSMHDGLLSICCVSCGWEESGTYSPSIEGLPSSPVNRVSVQWLDGHVTPFALKALRAASSRASEMSLVDLSASIASGRPFELGVVAEHARAELSRDLEQAGFLVISETVS